MGVRWGMLPLLPVSLLATILLAGAATAAPEGVAMELPSNHVNVTVTSRVAVQVHEQL